LSLNSGFLFSSGIIAVSINNLNEAFPSLVPNLIWAPSFAVILSIFGPIK
jgi:hypothetical protein